MLISIYYMKKKYKYNYKLPLDIIRKIYQFDSTYHEIFKNNVLCYIKKNWMILWTCKFTGKCGIDLTGTNDCKLFNIYNQKDFIYTYNDCTKICKKLKQINKNFNYKPIKA